MAPAAIPDLRRTSFGNTTPLMQKPRDSSTNHDKNANTRTHPQPSHGILVAVLVLVHGWMDKRMDEWMNGNGWMDGWVDGWVDWWIYEWMDGNADQCQGLVWFTHLSLHTYGHQRERNSTLAKLHKRPPSSRESNIK